MTGQPELLPFRISPWASAVPLITFLVGAVVLVSLGAPAVEGMILAAMLGISLGMLFARDRGDYTERVFVLMANRTATVAVVCWLWAGVFSGILGDSGLVEGIVWLGWKLHLSGAAFVVGVFVSSALFAVSVGTGLGTVVGFTAVMYPAGIVLGGDPAALMGAIFSGAAFGDNLAPVSDTTIVSAATQETDVGAVVASRLKYVLPAAAISALLFLVCGGQGSTVDRVQAERLLEQTADATGLWMLIPAGSVFLIAVRGRNFLAALTAGIAATLFLGPLVGAFTLGQVFYITADRSVAGSAVDGAIGLIPTAILTLLLVTSIGLMAEGGVMKQMMDWLDRTVARSVRGAETAIVLLISFANLCVSVNTVAMITAGPLANQLRKRHGISACRSANLLDTISCSFPYLLPYASTIIAAEAIQRDVAQRYPFVDVVPWSREAPYIFYGIVLLPIMIFAVVSGYGRSRG
ncbi:MAG: Na+/H+ antiporter NhaC family protein [Pirellulales bacterium]